MSEDTYPFFVEALPFLPFLKISQWHSQVVVQGGTRQESLSTSDLPV